MFGVTLHSSMLYYLSNNYYNYVYSTQHMELSCFWSLPNWAHKYLYLGGWEDGQLDGRQLWNMVVYSVCSSEVLKCQCPYSPTMVEHDDNVPIHVYWEDTWDLPYNIWMCKSQPILLLLQKHLSKSTYHYHFHEEASQINLISSRQDNSILTLALGSHMDCTNLWS